MLHVGRLFVAATVLLSAAAAGHAQGELKPYGANKWYWQYQGKPVLLLGASSDDNLFQISGLQAELDEMVTIGANCVRNTMSDRDTGNERAFRRLSSGQYDLSQWNGAYWTKFDTFLRWTRDRQIFVQIEVWDRFDHSRTQWQTDPYHPDNNVNYTNAQSGLADDYPAHPGQNKQPFFFTVPALDNNTVVLQFQNAFVDKMLSYSLTYGHVLYCMDNETSADPEWAKYWNNRIKNAAAAAGKTVPTTEMWDNWDITAPVHKQTLDRPDLYSFADISQNTHISDQTHWDRIQSVRNYLSSRPWPLNNTKIYGADGGPYGNNRDGVERFWRQMIGGLASTRFHRPTAGLGISSPAKASVRAARKMESLIKMWDVNPRNDLLTNRGTDEAYLAAKPGDAYALYFTNGGSVGLKLGGYPRNFDLRWINIGNGNWGSQTTLTGGSTVTINAPGSGHWAAAIVASQSSGGGTLPAPWQSTDVGAVAASGSAGESGGVFTIQASGADIWGTADEFHYAYQTLNGDGEITARVTGMDNTDPWAKAGVMIRESLSPDSIHAMVIVTPSNGLAYQRRLTTGGSSFNAGGPSSVTAPHWVRLVRIGDTIAAYESSDGSAWNLVGSDTIVMASSVYVGLAATSHNDGAINTSTYDNVVVISLGDADGDGLPDAAEIVHGYDPGNSDQDGNGTPDGFDDWDGDGIDNQTEIAQGTYPGAVPGGGGTPPPGRGSGSSGGCGATGAELLLILALLAVRRSLA